MNKLIIFFFLIPSFSIAQQSQRQNKDLEFSVGIASALRTNIRRDNNLSNQSGDIAAQFFPGLGFRFKGFSLRGPGLNYQAWSGATELNLFTRLGGDNYRTEFMSERRNSFFTGASLRIFFLTLEYSNDITGKSHGAIGGASLGKRFVVNKTWATAFRGGYEFYSENYVDYYYGVQPEETIDFEEYTGEDTYNPFVAWANFFSISKKWSFNVFTNLRKYSSEVADSPTVRDEYEMSLFTLLSYRIY